MSDTAIKVENLTKEYRLGVINAGTLQADLQTKFARMKGKANPNSKIGKDDATQSNKLFKALDDVSFEVKKGDALAVIGSNGAGKSTLLKLISRITAPTYGKISINGRIASMLEVGTGFHKELTGRENIYMNGAILGMSKQEIDKRLEEIIDFSQIEQFIDTPVKRYSSGMFVRLAFSVAAHLNSDILILDEVLSVGDESFKQKSLGKMNEISKNQGKTILYVSHSMNTVKRLCTRAIVLDGGRLIFDGDTDGGIAQYMNICGNFQATNEVDLTQITRSKFLAQRALMKKLKVCNKQTAIFESEEKFEFVLEWQALENITDAYIRIIVKSADRTPIGMCISKMPISAKSQQEVKTHFEADFSMLSGSKYYCDISISQKSASGRFDNLDRAVDAFAFEYAGNSNSESILWQSSVWGNMVFPDIQII